MKKTDKIYIAGHRGLVGGALFRLLDKTGYTNLITRSSSELDLREQSGVRNFFEKERPDYVFLAAAKVGGIHANSTFPAEFIYNNLALQNNVIESAYRSGVTKLLFLGSSCIYPKHAVQPMTEDSLLTGILEPTNEPYAIAKIAGIKMCQSYHTQYGCRFISAMPTNLYGPGDNYDLQNSHVLPALIRKFHEAKVNNAEAVTIWGTGSPRREFLHADDAAKAFFFLMQEYELPEIINVGSGKDSTIAELAVLIKELTGYAGKLIFDDNKPDGAARKLLNVEKINTLGWHPRIELRHGIKNTYEDFANNYNRYINV